MNIEKWGLGGWDKTSNGFVQSNIQLKKTYDF